MTSGDTHEGSSIDAEADLVAQLMQTAGRRQSPPAEAYQQTLLVAIAAWKKKLRRHRQRRLLGWAAACVVLLAGVVWVLGPHPPGSTVPIAALDRVIGAAEIIAGDDRDWSPLAQATRELAPGSRLRTLEGGRIGIVLGGGASLRLADSTVIELESMSRIHLVTGRVYLDTAGARGDSGGIELVTALGVASDVGTQFEVQYRDAGYRLRVRDGAVRLLRDAASTALHSGAGEQLVIRTDGSVERTRIAPYDPEWQWVETVAAAPDIDAQPLTTLLEWVTRETGRSIRYAEPALERRAAQTVLHGDIRHLAPLDALEVMLATTDFEYSIAKDGTIVIRSKVSRPREP